MQFSRSRPGQPPRRDTGKLAQSIFWSGDRTRMMVVVGTKKKYGVYLEKGATVPPRVPKRKRMLVFGVGGKWVFTRYAAGFRLAPRPFVLVTLKKHKQRIEQIVMGSGKKAMQGAVTIG